jgi:CRP/FNR family putative post-exponential-phase nitrogen-starvation transcriptional regulator
MRNVVSLAETKTYPLTNRLASFILLAAPNGHYKEMHGNAAEYLGVSYRHLLFVLAEFVQKGYLEKTNKGYQVTNKKALVKLSKEMNTGLNISSLFANMEDK